MGEHGPPRSEVRTSTDLRRNRAVLLSSLIDVPSGQSGRLPAADDTSRYCLREWLARVPDPRSVMGRWHLLGYVLALAVCAFTAAGHDSPVAI